MNPTASSAGGPLPMYIHLACKKNTPRSARPFTVSRLCILSVTVEKYHESMLKKNYVDFDRNILYQGF